MDRERKRKKRDGRDRVGRPKVREIEDVKECEKVWRERERGERERMERKRISEAGEECEGEFGLKVR